MQKKQISVAIIGGIALGTAIYFSLGAIFIFVLAFSTILLIKHISDEKERDFIIRIFLFAFGIRIFLSLGSMFWAISTGNILNYVYRTFPDYSTPYIFDDSGYYTLRGQFISLYWLGVPLSHDTVGTMVKSSYGLNGFIILLASYFTLFGYSPISSRFINCLFGSSTVIFVYLIAKDIFGEKPAKLSAILVTLFPSLIIWSIVNMKEPSFIFSIYVMLWSVLKLNKTGKFYYLVITCLSLWLQDFIRPGYREYIYLNVAIILFYFFYGFVIHLFKKKKIIFLFIIFCTSVLFILLYKERINQLFETLSFRAVIAHRGALSEEGFSYRLLPDELLTDNMSMRTFIQMLLKGWLHIIFEPFLWNIQSMNMLFAFPQMVLWYLLIPFSIIGITISIRYKFKESLLLILYFFIVISILAITGGNIGTAFRARDIITPLALVFSSVGLIEMFLIY